jgi:hypothetical protein
VEQAERVVMVSHGVIVPLHPTVGLPAHEQPSPYLAWQAVCVPCAAHGGGVPLQVDEVLQLQPYSLLQAVDVAFAPHGVMAPTHTPPTSEQPWQ